MSLFCEKLTYVKIYFSLLFLTSYTLFSYAQAPDTLWTKTFGGNDREDGYSVQQTTDSGYIIAGYTESFGAGMYNAWLIKTNTSGDSLWTKIFGGDSSDVYRSVQQTFDGGYIVTGSTRSFGVGQSDVWLIKADSLGDTLWTKTFGGNSADNGYSVKQTTDGGYIITGNTNSFGAGAPGDVWLIKTDSLGDTLWTKTFGGDSSDAGHSVQQTTDSGYIITGFKDFIGGNSGDVWLIKTDSLGDTLWTKTFGGNSVDIGNSVQQTTDSGYIIAGYTASFGAGSWDLYLIKTDTNGDIVWTRAYGGADTDGGRSVQQTFDGGYIATGSTGSFGVGQSDVWLIKTDSLGDTLWTKTFGGNSVDIGNSVQQTADSGYVIVGSTMSFGSGDFDIYVIKTEPDVGIEEKEVTSLRSSNFGATIISGPLLLPKGQKYKIFDITGRITEPDKIKPGIYFIEIDGKITKKLVKLK